MALCTSCREWLVNCFSSDFFPLLSAESAGKTAFDGDDRYYSVLQRNFDDIFRGRLVCWMCCRLYILLNSWPEARNRLRQLSKFDSTDQRALLEGSSGEWLWLETTIRTNSWSPYEEVVLVRPVSAGPSGRHVRPSLPDSGSSKYISFHISDIKQDDSEEILHLLWDPSGKTRFRHRFSHLVVRDKREPYGDGKDSFRHGSKRLRITDATVTTTTRAAVQQEDGAFVQPHLWLTKDRIAMIRGWLSECITSHDAHCRNRVLDALEHQRLPERLIHIGGSESEVSLVLTGQPSSSISSDQSQEQERGQENWRQRWRYATLSHCWGKDPLVTLTCANHDEWIHHIPIETLGKTFREAILFCRGMDIPYLWIDSLCIVQDSPGDEDWRIESSRMHHVYGGAFLNIAATASDNCDGGLFRPTDELLMDALEIVLPNKIRLLGRFVEAPPALYHSFGASPLLRRGWVLQECFMAARTLHFTEHQAIMQCSTRMAVELGSLSEDWRYNHTNATMLSREASQGRVRAGPRDIIDTNPSLFLYDFNPQDAQLADLDILWIRVLEDFMLSQLTREIDRFHALSGLAALFEKLYARNGTINQYLAGCWTDSLAKWLAWYVVEDTDDSTHTTMALEARHPLSLCPSWSCFLHSGRHIRSWANFAHFDESEEILQLIQILFVYEDTENPFGALKSAPVQVRTRVFVLEGLDAMGLAPGYPHFFGGGATSAHISGGRNGDLYGGSNSNRSSFLTYRLCWDGKRPAKLGSGHLRCAILLMSAKQGCDLNIVGLLIKAGPLDMYERLGTVCLEAKWADSRAQGIFEVMNYFSEENMPSETFCLT